GRDPSRASVLAGAAVSFIAALFLLRAIRPALLLDAEPSWALPRFALGLAVVALCGACGTLSAGGFLLWSRTRSAGRELPPLALPRAALGLLAAGALAAGILLRFAGLERVPEPLWLDDVSLIGPALSLEGSPRDFADSVRAAPAGVARPYGSVGVLYLEAYRLALASFGTTVVGVRLLSALAGSLSLVTAGLLGRALLPRGGGALAVLALAGLRWSLILSRWGWVQIVLAPIVDVACLLLIAARRRASAMLALAAGAVAGLGAHVYLSAWIAAAGLVAFAAWPLETAERTGARLRLAALVLLGFGAAAAPLFLLREGRRAPYFARAGDHNVVSEVRRERSPLPPLAAAADALAGPWLLADPSPRNDLPGRRRLGWLLGVPVALCFARAILRPRSELSALLLAQAVAAFAASVAGGQAGSPNGARFAYLTTLTALASAAGALALSTSWRERWRRPAAAAAVGLIAIAGAAGARDALLDWPTRRETFDGFHGQDTLIGRAAARWAERGTVSIQPGLGHSDVLIRAVSTYRLGAHPRTAGSGRPPRRFRVVSPAAPPAPGERVVERVRDGWGREWAVVLGRAGREP
ncbi:MAG: hypothetical protein ACRD3M_11850, partial [Thermoanaerobaculia bacterium]